MIIRIMESTLYLDYHAKITEHEVFEVWPGIGFIL
jgi:hypothetical protein